MDSFMARIGVAPKKPYPEMLGSTERATASARSRAAPSFAEIDASFEFSLFAPGFLRNNEKRFCP
jgi:hypothetical protein